MELSLLKWREEGKDERDRNEKYYHFNQKIKLY